MILRDRANPPGWNFRERQAPARCREVQLADDVLELDRVAEGARDPLDLARRIAGGVGEVWLAA
jgi:hypothetical protein